MHNENKYNRHSIRLKGFDYSQPGMYFITICAENRENLFGKIIDEQMILNQLGKIVEKEWYKTVEKRKNVGLDEFIVMPNHLHGIVLINYRVVTDCNQSLQKTDCNQSLHKFGPQMNNLFAIIRGFKGAVTKQINLLINNKESGSIWQSRFYDHIIRNEQSLNKIRNYIYNNPGCWPDDIENSNIHETITEQRRKNYYKNIY